ncbi:hypothetical protein CEP51_000350 [Fusarium floridanum]|uniref:Uncharacterized protein n=1 Tax=Fusarium floridanum TaxID=1325733 RepID=A0A428SMV5_9HYPO|nr:hypothetical protein CEP51_000350 [Fusarium floridanum]
MFRPVVLEAPEIKPVQYSELYGGFKDLDGANKALKDRYEYGFGQQFDQAEDIAAKNRLKLNHRDALDLFVRDRGLSTSQKVWGGMDVKPQPGVAVEQGTLSKLALAGQNLLSDQTRVINRCIEKPGDRYLDQKIGEFEKKGVADQEAKRKDILGKDRGRLYEMALKGESPDDALIQRLLLNGFKYWDSAAISKSVRRRFYEMARERQAEGLKYAMEKATPRARKQFQRMLNDLKTSKSGKSKDDGSMGKFLGAVGEAIVDIGLEMLQDAASSNFFVLPVIGPAPTQNSSLPETDIFEWLINGYEKRGLAPPAYDALKAGEAQFRDILKTTKGWLEADGKTFWKDFQPQITDSQDVADANDGKLGAWAVDMAEQIQMLQVYTLWSERVDPGNHPWLWEVESDKTELVTELSNKYLNEGPEAMYSFVGSYSYRGKRPLSRLVACSVVSEALENILTSVTGVDAGGVHDSDEKE